MEEEMVDTVDEVEEIEEDLQDIEEVPLPKKRGRPKGSTNKPKEKAAPTRTPTEKVEKQEIDYDMLSRALSDHLAVQKTRATQARQSQWTGFFT